MYGFGWGGGRRRGVGGYGNSMPQFSGREERDMTSIATMAAANGWTVGDGIPTMADGSRIELAGGPIAGEQWRPQPPIVTGTAGYWPFVAMTAGVRTRSGSWTSYAVTAMMMPGRLPAVHIYPESWRATVTSMTPEINLEFGEFNDRYSVFSANPQAVYAVLSPRTMALLLTLPPFDEIWTAGPNLCVARIDPHNVNTLNTHLQMLTTAAKDMPSSMWDPIS